MTSIDKLKDRMTPKRFEWLKELSEKGISKRHHSPVGCQCMRLGWTQWVINADGKFIGERLTTVGREKLNAAIKGETDWARRSCCCCGD